MANQLLSIHSDEGQAQLPKLPQSIQQVLFVTARIGAPVESVGGDLVDLRLIARFFASNFY